MRSGYALGPPVRMCLVRARASLSPSVQVSGGKRAQDGRRTAQSGEEEGRRRESARYHRVTTISCSRAATDLAHAAQTPVPVARRPCPRVAGVPPLSCRAEEAATAEGSEAAEESTVSGAEASESTWTRGSRDGSSDQDRSR